MKRRNSAVKSPVCTVRNMANRAFAILHFFVLKSVGLSPWRFDFELLIEWELDLNYYNLGFWMTFNHLYYNVALAMFMSYMNYKYFFEQNKTFPKNVGLLSEEAAKYCQGLSLESYVTVLLIYMFRQEVHINILNKMPKFDDQLFEISRRKVQNGFLVYIFFFFELSITIAILQLTANEMHDKSFEQWYITVMPSFFYSWMFMHYTMTLDFLIRRIKMINLIIKNVKYGDRLTFGPVIKQAETRTSINQEIECLGHIFNELSDMFEGLTKFYEIPLFVAGLNIIGIGTFISYDIHSSYYNGTPLTDAEQEIYKFWFSLVIVEILLLGLFYFLVYKEVKLGKKGMAMIFKRYYTNTKIEIEEVKNVRNRPELQVEIHRADSALIYADIP